MPTLGMPELLVILLIVVVLFGAKRFPEIGRGLGALRRSLRSDPGTIEGLTKDEGHANESARQSERLAPREAASARTP